MSETIIKDKDKFSRVKQWENFSDKVIKHIEEYTLPQYGDSDVDQIDGFSVEDCWKNVQRYFNRRNSNARGTIEQKRDLLKIAHYMCFILSKYEEGGDNA